ncbi:zinc-finger of the FCS-type, C2-C2 [Stylosanthes scabra]|uniref:Zinc-finger of the FCS-type, C2-C2 n=1 Tax=Stylosanthes scabra TaxID=79078 RepID=A0ABU6XA42_9FABA|nr:zinc-finger of the FCS-type, C2-C2 [Stylosanthes scabra]
MLLRNRSRAVTKPSLMADHSSSSQQSSQNQSYSKRTIPSLFGSPKFIRDFTTKCLSLSPPPTTESLRSPTSILDARAVSPFAFGNPFSHENKKGTQTVHQNASSENTASTDDSRGIGLALVKNSAEQNKGNLIFGTRLRVKIPPLPPPSTFSPQTCHADDAVIGGRSSEDPQNSGIYGNDSPPTKVVVTDGVLSLSEMELSEEYTRVICHGPNPRTTHIFNNCILEGYFSHPKKPQPPSGSFLSFCYTCNKHLDQTQDIFIYRGEKAFCSPECRHKEMVLDGVENI